MTGDTGVHSILFNFVTKMTGDLTKDLEETEKFIEQAQSGVVKQALNDLKQKLQYQIEQAKFKQAGSSTPKRIIQNSGRPLIKLATYAYDESDNFVKLYYTLNGIQNLPAENVTAHFTDDSFDVHVTDLDGKDYTISAIGFTHPIDPEKSLVKQKADSLLVMMKKAKSGTWSELLKIVHAKKNEEKMKADNMDVSDPQAGLMNMMKKMYDEGDDDMKRNIRKAWHESQSKKMGDGMGGAGDLGLDF
uniref:Calcyclin-binding protein n=2 Tax=Panagrolaimus sp. JU765 TaxID=591449 RepID=A0AC34PWX5_9BILA